MNGRFFDLAVVKDPFDILRNQAFIANVQVMLIVEEEGIEEFFVTQPPKKK